MFDWKTLVCSLIASVIVAVLTHKLTVWSDEEKLIHAEREKLYLEIVEKVDQLINHTMVVWDYDYVQFFINEKHRVKLIASSKTIDCYEKIFCVVIKTFNELIDFEKANDPRQDEGRMYRDEFGDLVSDHIDEEEIGWYQAELNKFKLNNRPDPAMVLSLINDLYDSMRSDLRSKT